MGNIAPRGGGRAPHSRPRTEQGKMWERGVAGRFLRVAVRKKARRSLGAACRRTRGCQGGSFRSARKPPRPIDSTRPRKNRPPQQRAPSRFRMGSVVVRRAGGCYCARCCAMGETSASHHHCHAPYRDLQKSAPPDAPSEKARAEDNAHANHRGKTQERSAKQQDQGEQRLLRPVIQWRGGCHDVFEGRGPASHTQRNFKGGQERKPSGEQHLLR